MPFELTLTRKVEVKSYIWISIYELMSLSCIRDVCCLSKDVTNKVCEYTIVQNKVHPLALFKCLTFVCYSFNIVKFNNEYLISVLTVSCSYEIMRSLVQKKIIFFYLMGVCIHLASRSWAGCDTWLRSAVGLNSVFLLVPRVLSTFLFYLVERVFERNGIYLC